MYMVLCDVPWADVYIYIINIPVCMYVCTCAYIQVRKNRAWKGVLCTLLHYLIRCTCIHSTLLVELLLVCTSYSARYKVGYYICTYLPVQICMYAYRSIVDVYRRTRYYVPYTTHTLLQERPYCSVHRKECMQGGGEISLLQVVLGITRGEERIRMWHPVTPSSAYGSRYADAGSTSSTLSQIWIKTRTSLTSQTF